MNYHQPIDENYCDPEVRPLMEQECRLAACPPAHSHFPSSAVQPSYYLSTNLPLTHKLEDDENQVVLPSVRGNQWRTGPWGSVSHFYWIIYNFVILYPFNRYVYDAISTLNAKFI